MEKMMRKVAILSLSLMLVSTFAVSPVLPEMLAHFTAQGLASAQVEWLFSLPSFAILTVLSLDPWLGRILSERAAIILGLLGLSLGGMLPVVLDTYPFLVLSRLILGAGIGLINARAITIISEYYHGKERQVMLGLRGSAEVVGSALLTLMVGALIAYGWQKVFIVYGLGLVVLLLYCLFVSKPPEAATDAQVQAKVPLTSSQYMKILALAGLAFLVIAINSANTLRLPLIIESEALGSARQASWLLSAMMLMGLVAGLVFASLMSRFREGLFTLALGLMGVAMLLMWQASHLAWLTLGALGAGFTYSLVLNTVFTHLAETMPKTQLNQATTLVLLGCNLGGGGAASLLQMIGLINATPRFPFLVYALLLLLVAVLLWSRQGLKKRA